MKRFDYVIVVVGLVLLALLQNVPVPRRPVHVRVTLSGHVLADYSCDVLLPPMVRSGRWDDQAWLVCMSQISATWELLIEQQKIRER